MCHAGIGFEIDELANFFLFGREHVYLLEGHFTVFVPEIVAKERGWSDVFSPSWPKNRETLTTVPERAP